MNVCTRCLEPDESCTEVEGEGPVCQLCLEEEQVEAASNADDFENALASLGEPDDDE